MLDTGYLMLDRKITEYMVSGVGCQGWAARYIVEGRGRLKAQGSRRRAKRIKRQNPWP
jgi:hypothetical protein